MPATIVIGWYKESRDDKMVAKICIVTFIVKIEKG